MKKYLLMILISIITAFIFISGGYGLWEKTLAITGHLSVIESKNKDESELKFTENEEDISKDTDLQKDEDSEGSSEGSIDQNLSEK